MPLRALINDSEVIGPFLSDSQWECFKVGVKSRKSSVRLLCCGGQGFLRKSKLGTKHFYHRASTCNWKPESLQHLKAKEEILFGCRRAGFEAIPEASGGDWRADVLASRGTAKIAFEVQWSRQTLGDTLERQERYDRDGIRCAWFFRTLPSESSKDLPMFLISQDSNGALQAHAADQTVPLGDLIYALLTRQIRFCSEMRFHSKSFRINFHEFECWKCHKPSHIYRAHTSFNSACTIGCPEELYSDEEEFAPDVLAVAKRFLSKPEASRLRLGELKPRYSNTQKRSYMSFGCYWCDALFGQWFMYEMGQETVASYEETVPLRKPITEPLSHWCWPGEGNFCQRAYQVRPLPTGV